ncbi:MAG: permease [Candidatus Ratteibacteria bacterium]
MKVILSLTFIFLLISFFADRKKTFDGIIKGLKMFLGLLPTLLNVLILVSVFLCLVPNETLANLLGKNSGVFGIMVAAILGSVALIPGFIAYPLASVLIKSGVSYRVVAVFITTLLMVGVLTLPLEIKFFGVKVALIRNVLSFIGAIIIGLIIGIFL